MKAVDFFYSIALRNVLFILTIYIFDYINNFPRLNLNFLIIFFISLIILTISLRVIIRDLLMLFTILGKRNLPRVAIYGAGAAGAALMRVLQLEASHKVLFYVDDNPQLWNRTLYGCKIYPPFSLDKYVVI